MLSEKRRHGFFVCTLCVPDALQLAAAFAAAEGRPASLELITLDDRLCMAARKEGFAVVEIVPTD
jgi:hypothetical protein